ncbi:MAG: YwbE family protein [Methanomicrobiaceae archaeon]|nr:YwbE family protein [Methanomicrobiaceae archaeon]
MAEAKDGRLRNNLSPGIKVRVVLKKDQKSGKLTEGTVKEVLTGSSFHPHGIKVRLDDGSVGRVRHIA